MALKDNRFLRKLNIYVENISPLHIGTNDNEMLINSEDNTVFIPGTTMAGALRAYLENNNYKNVNKLFGKDLNMSKIFVYDTVCSLQGMEIRPAVRIDKEFGVAIKGGKFERNFITTGHKFVIELEIFAANESEELDFKEAIYNCILGINNGDITLGAYKTSGAGLFKVSKIEECSLNLEDKNQLFSYLQDKIRFKEILVNELKNTTFKNNDITFTLKATLDTPLLIKVQDQMDANQADGQQIKNNKGEYIIPGTSLKGIIRGQGEKILKYHNKLNISKYIFGSEDSKDIKIASNFKTFDSVIENAKVGKYNRIKLNKFTGGVIKSALMDDDPVLGDIKLQGKYKYTGTSIREDIGIAIIALVFRDIAIGNLSLGSGYNIGRGRVKGSRLIITKGEKVIYDYDFHNENLNKDELQKYFNALLNKEDN